MSKSKRIEKDEDNKNRKSAGSKKGNKLIVSNHNLYDVDEETINIADLTPNIRKYINND